MDLARVSIVGTSCSGKTTFARRLSAILGAPHVELDALHWGPNWTMRPDFRESVARAMEQPRWIADGNYSQVRDLVWSRATAIVWLNYSFPRNLTRALWRTGARIVTGEQVYSGNRETVRNAFFHKDALLWFILRTYAERRRRYPDLLARESAHATVVELCEPRAAERLLREIALGRPSAGGHTEA